MLAPFCLMDYKTASLSINIQISSPIFAQFIWIGRHCLQMLPIFSTVPSSPPTRLASYTLRHRRIILRASPSTDLLFSLPGDRILQISTTYVIHHRTRCKPSLLKTRNGDTRDSKCGP